MAMAILTSLDVSCLMFVCDMSCHVMVVATVFYLQESTSDSYPGGQKGGRKSSPFVTPPNSWPWSVIIKVRDAERVHLLSFGHTEAPSTAFHCCDT